MSKTIVEMDNITKVFPNVKAIDHGRFDLREGEIHSLIGENGAGKSTMMKILYGLYTPEEGTITVNGKVLKNHTPHQAIELGIGMVHQEFMLVKELTVLENIILGFEPKLRGGRIDFEKSKSLIKHYIDTYGMDVQHNKRVQNIPVGEAQRVEIIKALYRGAQILILDEPTAVLTPQEAIKLFEILKKMKEDGKTIVFISHRLKEIMEISDRVTVMRQGKYVGTVNKCDTSIPELAKLMVGREVFLNIQTTSCASKEKVLEVKDIYVPGEREHSKIRGVSFDIYKGEVLGVAGVDGNGQNELAEAIAGLRKIEKGQVLLKGKNIENLSPKKVRKAGLSHIPEDRNKRGLNKEFSIKDNLIPLRLFNNPFSKGIAVQDDKVKDYSDKLIKEFDIRPPNGEIKSGSLSGGNAQKIVVAREVDIGADLLIASQPTRGVDIGSIESIRTIIDGVKRQGTSVLLISADLDEVMSLSDRIIVMYEGKITGMLKREEVDEFKLGLLMTGGKSDES